MNIVLQHTFLFVNGVNIPPVPPLQKNLFSPELHWVTLIMCFYDCDQTMCFQEKYKRALADTENLRTRSQKMIEDAKLYGEESFPF